MGRARYEKGEPFQSFTTTHVAKQIKLMVIISIYEAL